MGKVIYTVNATPENRKRFRTTQYYKTRKQANIAVKRVKKDFPSYKRVMVVKKTVPNWMS